MDGKTLRDKLVGSEDERAVSPVIGVILMVAITVILAAVIATLVMDFGDSTDSPINAAVTDETDDGGNVTITIEKAGNAEEFDIRGEGITGDPSMTNFEQTGDTLTLTHGDHGGLLGNPGDTVTIVAIEGDNEENAGSFEVPESP